MSLVKEIYLLTNSYLKEETFALTSQTKRAAISIPANIAEGIGRNYKKDTIQFLHVSRGSVYELETLLNIAVMVGFIDQAAFHELSLQIDQTLKILNGLIHYFEKSKLK